MPHFEVYGKCPIGKEWITLDVVQKALTEHLAKYFSGSIRVTSAGVQVKGNLKSIWERAITKATVNLSIEERKLLYRVTGESSLGTWPWVWFCLGLITGIFLIWFAIDVIEYVICRDRPKRYFEEAFEAIRFEIG